MTSKQLSYIRIITDKFAETFNFYKDILNLELKFGSENDNYCEFETGNTDIALFDKKAMEEQTGISFSNEQSNIIIIFPVENVDKEFERLKELNVDIVTEPVTRKDWMVRTMHIRDPNGHIIEINTRIELLNKEDSDHMYV